MKKVAPKKNYADIWPPIIDRGDIGWEIAIVLVAIIAAILAGAGLLQPFGISLVVLVVMSGMYVWRHTRKR